MEGKEAVCPKCGNIVKPKILQWALFLVGDVTDEIIASFPPSIMNRPTEGMIIVAQGLLGENEEFLVYRWSLPADTKAGATTPEAPLQTSSSLLLLLLLLVHYQSLVLLLLLHHSHYATTPQLLVLLLPAYYCTTDYCSLDV